MLDETKGLWDEYLHETLWFYHYIPHSTIQEIPFRMDYGVEAMVLVKNNATTWRRITFDVNTNSDDLDNSAYLLDEAREMAHIRDFTAKQRIVRGFNNEVRQRRFHK